MVLRAPASKALLGVVCNGRSLGVLTAPELSKAGVWRRVKPVFSALCARIRPTACPTSTAAQLHQSNAVLLRQKADILRRPKLPRGPVDIQRSVHIRACTSARKEGSA